MEETLSTLDYALRAKSIRNKPEVNQHMPKDALVQDYVALVTRLKSELHAAREKQGVYFSDETWSQMVAEQELKETEMPTPVKFSTLVLLPFARSSSSDSSPAPRLASRSDRR